jgi:photosystem II stability/assembly factor-like uncharacterized protein
MTVELGDLEERLANALKAAAASIPDEPPVEWGEVLGRRPPAPARRGRSRSRGRVWIVSAAAVVIVFAGVVVAVTLSAASHGTPTYASRLLTAAPQKASAPTAGAGDWRLLGYVSDSNWQVNPEGPHSGSIACPSSTSCYVVSGISEIDPDVAPVPGTVLNVSEDSGKSWAEYRMPPGLGLTSPLACPTADDQDCVAGGTDRAGPALLSTSDGGAHWSARSLPAKDGSPTELSCVSMTSCVALFRLPVNPLSFGERVNASNVIDVGGTLEAQIASTTDGGGTWRLAHLPTADVPQSVSCARGRCVVIAATPAHTVAGGVTRGAVFTSGDGGETWRAGKLPQGFGVVWSGPTQVDCVTFSTCWATGTVAVPPSGASSSSSLVSVAASSDDGGLTWQPRSLPADLAAPRLYSISCPRPEHCWLAGWKSATTTAGSPLSSVILSTSDGGESWRQEALSVAPGTLVGAISCPATNVCIGVGGVNAHTGRAAVYSNAAGPTSSH